MRGTSSDVRYVYHNFNRTFGNWESLIRHCWNCWTKTIKNGEDKIESSVQILFAIYPEVWVTYKRAKTDDDL